MGGTRRRGEGKAAQGGLGVGRAKGEGRGRGGNYSSPTRRFREICRRHRHFPISTFCATSAHAGGYWICNTGSDFDPCERKIFAAGATALKSCGRIGRNGASGSATNENDPFWGGFSGFGQAERAAEPPRGPRIESPAPPSEPPTALRPACGAPLPDPRSPQPVLAARDLATPPLAGRTNSL